MKKQIIFYLIFLNIFIFNNALAKTEFFQCSEKITDLRIGDDFLYKKGEIIGTNYIKLESTNVNPIISIHFRFKDNKNKPLKVIKNKDTNPTPIGFEVKYVWETEKSKTEIYYNFVKIKDTYAFNRTDFLWISKDNNNEQKHDYDSSGRCEKISENHYLGLFNKTSISKKKTKKIEKKKKIKKDIDKKILKGKRAFAMSWEGYDELIVGSLKFNEINLIGQLEFKLPNNDGECIGTYALSTIKGTWSILCKSKNINASGTLEWNSKDGSVKGDGTDNKGNKVKFKIAPEN